MKKYESGSQGSIKIRELPESERPRERLMARGASGLSNTELLAIIISSGTKNGSALTIAERVMSLEKGNLSAFSLYLPSELSEVCGIGPATACKIAAAIEFGKRVANAPKNKIKLGDPSAVAAYFAEMKDYPKEVFRVAMFNTKCELFMAEDVSVGGISSSSAAPREVFFGAVKRGAYAVVLLHNHPSGDPAPSMEDKETTARLCKAGKILGVKVMDHIIIGGDGYFSFVEENLIF